jgi:hypothetical protein
MVYEYGMSAEGFALSGDVHVWRGELVPADYTVPTPDGRATAHEKGDAMVSANFIVWMATREMIVVPPSTFRIAGLVTEADGPPGPVIGASVAVTAGVGAGLVTTTGEDGRYRLYGVAGDVQLQITKEGYLPHEQQYRVVDHLMLNVQVKLLNPRPDVSGTYTLTIAAADSCRAALPADLRLRNYTAVLTQKGSQLDVRLRDATFAVAGVQGDGFRGRVEPSQLVFSLSPFDLVNYGYYRLSYGDVVERLGDFSHLIVSGLARITESGPGFSGTLNGSMTVFAGELKSFPTIAAECRSADHRFTLRR